MTIFYCSVPTWTPGHGGKSGRFKSYEGVAMEYAFLVALAQGNITRYACGLKYFPDNVSVLNAAPGSCYPRLLNNQRR